MAKFAFIDVQNTETTTRKWLNFEIDWVRLTQFLQNEWGCDQVFYYLGIQEGDTARDEEFSRLKNEKVIIRPKYYFVHKVSDRLVATTCTTCAIPMQVRIDMGYQWKCNCDVELTVDVLDKAYGDNEIILFTGDGDFEFLIDTVLAKVSGNVSIVSTSKPRIRAGKTEHRLSKKLKKKKRVRVLEIDNLKNKIKSSTVFSK